MTPPLRNVCRRLPPAGLCLLTVLCIGCASKVPVRISDNTPVLNNSNTFIVDVVYVEGADMVTSTRAIDRVQWFVDGRRRDFAQVTTSFRVRTVGGRSTIERISPPRPHEKSIKLTDRGATIELDVTPNSKKNPVPVLVSVYADYHRVTLGEGDDDSSVLRFDPRSKTKIAIELGQDRLHLRYQ